jgi:hypothetical protein
MRIITLFQIIRCLRFFNVDYVQPEMSISFSRSLYLCIYSSKCHAFLYSFNAWQNDEEKQTNNGSFFFEKGRTLAYASKLIIHGLLRYHSVRTTSLCGVCARFKSSAPQFTRNLKRFMTSCLYRL